MDEPIRGTVLIVDDVPTNTAILESLLGIDYEVATATSGLEALELAERIRPDVVLLDIVMPGMDGHEVCRRLKASAETRNIPVIFITAMNEEADEELGLSIGAIDYVTKPFNLPIVRARVRNQLVLKRQADQIAANNEKLGDLFARVETDLKAAADLQRSLLPAARCVIHGTEFAHFYRASQFLGGDMLNYFPIGDGKAAFYLADVAGHGVPAALLSVSLSNTMSAEFCARVGGVVDAELGVPTPSAVLAAINRRFLGDSVRMDYITMIYGVLDAVNGTARVCQAGHPSPILFRRDGTTEVIGEGGFPIGLFEESTFEDISVDIAAGDRIVLFSDGITECESPSFGAFGEERLIEAVRADGDEFIANVPFRTDAWLEGRPVGDDMSVIDIRIGGSPDSRV